MEYHWYKGLLLQTFMMGITIDMDSQIKLNRTTEKLMCINACKIKVARPEIRIELIHSIKWLTLLFGETY